jgi:hypothetical protein
LFILKQGGGVTRFESAKKQKHSDEVPEEENKTTKKEQADFLHQLGKT